jgi:hypothetical protein
MASRAVVADANVADRHHYGCRERVLGHSMVGFVAAALSFWGLVLPGEAWRPLAIASAVVSLVGITLFFGTWPRFNTLAALVVNVAVLVSLLLLHWPADAVLRS